MSWGLCSRQPTESHLKAEGVSWVLGKVVLGSTVKLPAHYFTLFLPWGGCLSWPRQSRFGEGVMGILWIYHSYPPQCIFFLISVSLRFYNSSPRLLWRYFYMWIVVQIDISRRKSVVEIPMLPFCWCHSPPGSGFLIHSDNLHLLVDAFKLLTFKVIIDVVGLIATTFVTTIDPRQCWFQLHGSTYTWILFNSKYHSITWSVESTDAEGLQVTCRSTSIVV